jgi:hypothetical protein
LRSALKSAIADSNSILVMQGSVSFLILAYLTVAKATEFTKFSISAPEQPSKKVAAFVMLISIKL